MAEFVVPEQGDDVSLVDFRCAEYSDGKVFADKEFRKQIIKMGIRKFARQTGINRETVALIADGKPVKPITLQKMMETLAREYATQTSVLINHREI